MSGRFSIDGRQAGILADRYIDVMFGDPGSTFLTVVQAPILAFAIGGVFKNLASDSLTLYFVLCLCAFFLGAVNSSREIVKERALYLRERMFNLSAGAYLVSKYRVQAILVVIQSAALVAIVARMVPLKVNLVLVSVVVLATSLTGTAVGLLISSWVKSADKAVAMVPLVIIPQILFSDFVIGRGKLSNWADSAEELMPVRWGYEMLREASLRDTSNERIVGAALVLALMCAACFALSLFKLGTARYS